MPDDNSTVRHSGGYRSRLTHGLHGRAELLDWNDGAGTGVFERFWMGRRILEGYRRAPEHDERRVCFVKIIPDPQVRTYMVGYRIWELRSNMERGSARVTLTPEL
jgi:hypothetical protein